MKPTTKLYVTARKAERDCRFHLDAMIRTIEEAKASAEPIPNPYSSGPDALQAERDLHAIIEGAAEVLDAWNDRRGKRGNLRQKVRKLLGYTYP